MRGKFSAFGKTVLTFSRHRIPAAFGGACNRRDSDSPYTSAYSRTKQTKNEATTKLSDFGGSEFTKKHKNEKKNWF